MYKLSGLIVDAADDKRGEVLREVYPTIDSLPELLKTARYVGEEDRSRLPDDLFALVLQENGESFRKFACATAGDTALSIAYFYRTAHTLPAEAQKVAAANLCEACSWYDIDPPEELQKVAVGVGTVFTTALNLPSIIDAVKRIGPRRQIAKESKGLVNPSLIYG